MAKGSKSSSSSSSCSCRGVAVILLLLCLAASTASGKTDAAHRADLFGIGILIQRNPPPRTVVKLPHLPRSIGSTTAAAGASASVPSAAAAADSIAGQSTVTLQVPAGITSTEADAALAAAVAGAADSYTTVTTTTTTTTTVTTTTNPGLAGQPSTVTYVTNTAPDMQPGVAAPAAVTVTAPVVPTTPPAAAAAAPTQEASEGSSHPILKPAFSTLPPAGTAQQPTEATPATTGTTTNLPTGLQPVMTVPSAASSSNSSSSSQMPPIPLAGPTVKAPPPWIFTQKDAKQTLLIGCSVPFEGSQQLVGSAVFSALKMAVTDLVPTELPGVNVNVTCINSKCEDIPAHMAVSKFATEGAIGVIGDICSRASVAAAGVANARKIPVISPASTSPSLSQVDYFFRTVPSDRFQGVADANLVRKFGANATAVVYEDSAYGYGLAFNFIAGFTKERGTVPVVYQFKSKQGDPQAAVAEVKAGVQNKGVQAVFMSTNNLTFVAEFLVAAKAANLSLPIFGGDALADYMLYEQINGRPSLIDKLTVTSVSPGSKDFVRAFTNYTQSTDPSTSYQAYAAHAYDAVAALLRAYKAAAAPKDGSAIIKELNKQEFQGVGGPVKFDEYGDAVPDNQTYVEVKFNGTSGARVVQGFVQK